MLIIEYTTKGTNYKFIFKNIIKTFIVNILFSFWLNFLVDILRNLKEIA